MTNELFMQGPEVYIPALLLSLLVTVIAYGAVPLIENSRFCRKCGTQVLGGAENEV